MYANFVVPGSLFDLQLPVETQNQVNKELDPPYEELFDAVEEHILFCLMEPWNQLQNEDNNFYSQVKKAKYLNSVERFLPSVREALVRLCQIKNQGLIIKLRRNCFLFSFHLCL